MAHDAGTLALQLLPDLFIVAPPALELFPFLLERTLDFREPLGRVEELSLARPVSKLLDLAREPFHR